MYIFSENYRNMQEFWDGNEDVLFCINSKEDHARGILCYFWYQEL